jgi:hypothetical protein
VAQLGYGDCFLDFDVIPHTRPISRAAEVSPPICVKGYSVEWPNERREGAHLTF